VKSPFAETANAGLTNAPKTQKMVQAVRQKHKKWCGLSEN